VRSSEGGDALKGDSLAVIVKDCNQDVNPVVIALVSTTDPNVMATKAHVEAVNLRAALMNPPPPVPAAK